MNGVIGMTEILLSTRLDSDQRNYVETLRGSGETLMKIIDDILHFSKLEARSVRLEAIDFDLRVAVEEVTRLLARRAQDKGLELASLIEDEVPTALRGDPFRIRQILTNLIGNAVKFTEEGEISVRAQLVEASGGAATVRFEVTDTGVGMSEEQQSRLFEAFSQADASTTRKYGGTGLGLAISRQLVELMGGEMGVTSEPGVGSTFWFTVRLEERPAAESKPRPRTELQDLRVLVADSNDTNRESLHQQIDSWEIEVESAEDGPRALRLLRAAAARGEPYDAAILDADLTGMGGMELIYAIKGIPAISNTRLVLQTPLDRRGDTEEGHRSGVAAYLVKPVRRSELYNCLATLLDAPAETFPSPAPGDAPSASGRTAEEDRDETRAHLLVAEDNNVNQLVAVEMLENLGYRVDVVGNGLEAVEALSHAPYAAVLMDCQMPEMDGYEATAEIRRREGSVHHTPIIAMTAHALQSERERALEAGMDDHISKPVKPEKLDSVLQRWLRRPAPEPLTSRSESPPTLDAPVDYSVLAGLSKLQKEGEPDILDRLTDMFLEEAPPRLAAIREAMERGDSQMLEEAAHALHGSCANLGAQGMEEICAGLEKLGRSQDLRETSDLLTRLEVEFERFTAVLEAELQRIKRESSDR